jgi:hypothetical protein
VHRWEGAPQWTDLAPGDPLPAPGPNETPIDLPIELTSPEPLFEPEGVFTDDMIKWDEPSWLDERRTETPASESGQSPPEASPVVSVEATPTSPAEPPATEPPTSAPRATAPPDIESPAPVPEHVIDPTGADDWIERLETDGLPEVGSDPLASTKHLPTLPVEPADRFEVIWPSGEIDEEFGATDVAEVGDHHPDLDRAGPTARVARAHEPVAPSAAEPPVAAGDEPIVPGDPGAGDDTEPLTDEVVLAVRRAVASIETGSLATRRRLADTPPDESPPGAELPLPGRIAARTEYNDWAPGVTSTGVTPPTTRSVFDNVPIDLPGTSSDVNQADQAVCAPVTVPVERTSALRRLIGSLRRR